jgi:hypothetical protein
MPCTRGVRPERVAKVSGQPGGSTRDLVHRFYQEQSQLDGGTQDRYTTGNDAAGLTQGYYTSVAGACGLDLGLYSSPSRTALA